MDYRRPPNAPIKLIVVGDENVGKTHLVSRYSTGRLPKVCRATIGAEFQTLNIPLQIGGTIHVELWDAAGQERFKSITTKHFKQAQGALIVYDVTDKESFLNAAKWLEEVRGLADPGVQVMLIGNKVDIVSCTPGDRRVDYHVASNYAAQNGLLFAEVSAVDGFGVKETFETLAQQVYLKLNGAVITADTGNPLGFEARLKEPTSAAYYGSRKGSQLKPGEPFKLSLDHDDDDPLVGKSNCCGFAP